MSEPAHRAMDLVRGEHPFPERTLVQSSESDEGRVLARGEDVLHFTRWSCILRQACRVPSGYEECEPRLILSNDFHWPRRRVSPRRDPEEVDQLLASTRGFAERPVVRVKWIRAPVLVSNKAILTDVIVVRPRFSWFERGCEDREWQSCQDPWAKNALLTIDQRYPSAVVFESTEQLVAAQHPVLTKVRSEPLKGLEPDLSVGVQSKHDPVRSPSMEPAA